MRVPPLTVAPIAVNDLHIKVNPHQGPLKHIKQYLLNVYHACWTDVISLYYYIKCKSAVFLDQTSVFEAPFCEIYGFFFLFFSPASKASRRSHLSDASSPNTSLPLPLPPCAALLCSGPGRLGAAEPSPSIHSEPNACVTASPPSPF